MLDRFVSGILENSIIGSSVLRFALRRGERGSASSNVSMHRREIYLDRYLGDVRSVSRGKRNHKKFDFTGRHVFVYVQRTLTNP